MTSGNIKPGTKKYTFSKITSFHKKIKELTKNFNSKCIFIDIIKPYHYINLEKNLRICITNIVNLIPSTEKFDFY